MSCRKFKCNSYCDGRRHHSSTTNIDGDITSNKKTGKKPNLSNGRCPICNRKNTMTVSDNTIQVEGLGDFQKNISKKKDSMYQKRWQKTF